MFHSSTMSVRRRPSQSRLLEGIRLRVHELIHDRIALEGCVCETCGTKGCHRPATWEIECRGVGVSGRLIYSCDEHCPDPAILSPQDEIRRLVER